MWTHHLNNENQLVWIECDPSNSIFIDHSHLGVKTGINVERILTIVAQCYTACWSSSPCKQAGFFCRLLISFTAGHRGCQTPTAAKRQSMGSSVIEHSLDKNGKELHRCCIYVSRKLHELRLHYELLPDYYTSDGMLSRPGSNGTVWIFSRWLLI